MRQPRIIILGCLSVVILLGAGCMSVTLQVQPEQLEVPKTLVGSDCVPYLFGLSFGTATVEQAALEGYFLQKGTERFFGSARPAGPIKKIRSIAVTYEAFLMFGQSCIEVTGE